MAWVDTYPRWHWVPAPACCHTSVITQTVCILSGSTALKYPGLSPICFQAWLDQAQPVTDRKIKVVCMWRNPLSTLGVWQTHCDGQDGLECTFIPPAVNKWFNDSDEQLLKQLSCLSLNSVFGKLAHSLVKCFDSSRFSFSHFLPSYIGWHVLTWIIGTLLYHACSLSPELVFSASDFTFTLFWLLSWIP